MNNLDIRLAWTDFVLDLQDLLIDKGVTTPMYIVGGAVRDAYLRGAIKDIDIAVDGDAIQMARHLADWLDGDIFIMDDERGVARVFAQAPDGQMILDLAQFRGGTLHDDLHDRDFTVNAMAADLLGDLSQLIDPVNGAIDLKQKVLRRCTDQSIVSDPIRILRAVRQSVQLGLKIHPDTLRDIRQHVSKIVESSPERIRDEFYNILRSSQPARAIRVLQHLGILKYIIDGIDKLIGIAQPPPHRFDVWNHTLLVVERMNSILTAISYRRTDNTAATFELGMLVIQFDRYRTKLVEHISREYGTGRSHQSLLILGALLHNLGKVDAVDDYVTASSIKAKHIADALRLTNDEQKHIKTMISAYRQVLDTDDWSTLNLHRFWFTYQESGIDIILLAIVDYLGTVGAELEQADWLMVVERVTILLDTYFNKYDTIVDPPLYLDGHQVMDLLDLSGGRIIGQLLSALREAQVVAEVNSVTEAQAFLEQYYRDNQ